jgi:hypothetical protein
MPSTNYVYNLIKIRDTISFLTKQSIYMFHMILSINNDNFPKQH